MPNHGKGGRPRHGAEVKSVAVALKTTPTIKAALEKAAAENGHSVTREVEMRLDASLMNDATDVTAQTRTLLSELAREIERAEQLTGKRWHTDLRTWAMVREALASGPIVRRCPDTDRLFSEGGKNNAAEMRRQLWEYREKLSNLNGALAHLGTGVPHNPDAFHDIAAPIYDYNQRDLEDAVNPPAEEMRPAINKIIAEMRQLEAERSELAEDYKIEQTAIVECITDAISDWNKDLGERGVMPADEYRPATAFVNMGGMFVRIPPGTALSEDGVRIMRRGKPDIIDFQPLKKGDGFYLDQNEVAMMGRPIPPTAEE